ncbi:MAG: porin family protein [Salibacteraceae bacterium]
MKKISSLLVVLMLTLGVFAQDGGLLRLGLRGSPNLSWLRPDTKGVDNGGLRFGYSFGITADLNVLGSENYTFSTGIELINVGGKLEYADQVYPDPNDRTINFPGTSEAIFRLRYIEIPWTLKLKTNEIGYLTYFGQVGMGTGFNIRARRDLDQSYSGGTLSTEDEDANSDVGFFRVSLILSAGAEYSLTETTSLMVGVTFNNGFTDVLTNKYFELDDNDGTVNVGSDNEPIEGPDWKAISNYLALNIGILF